MAKSIRSKVKKRNRSYMRSTVGEKVRTANIVAAAQRMDRKRNGRANTMTLLATKGALNRVDLCKEYYEAVVRPVTEAVPEPEAMAEEEEEDAKDEPVDDAEEALRARLGVSAPKRRFKGKLRGLFSSKAVRKGGQLLRKKEMVQF
mmetsp:Transcript_27202/g.87912  ORF Transcript_27202/g.87912 Transcript_27202/m.87912 type:complete len:146 (-) Transcript_27202:483-920(-)